MEIHGNPQLIPIVSVDTLNPKSKHMKLFKTKEMHPS
jgi:hypothetical protein